MYSYSVFVHIEQLDRKCSSYGGDPESEMDSLFFVSGFSIKFDGQIETQLTGISAVKMEHI